MVLLAAQDIPSWLADRPWLGLFGCALLVGVIAVYVWVRRFTRELDELERIVDQQGIAEALIHLSGNQWLGVILTYSLGGWAELLIKEFRRADSIPSLMRVLGKAAAEIAQTNVATIASFNYVIELLEDLYKPKGPEKLLFNVAAVCLISGLILLLAMQV